MFKMKSVQLEQYSMNIGNIELPYGSLHYWVLLSIRKKWSEHVHNFVEIQTSLSMEELAAKVASEAKCKLNGEKRICDIGDPGSCRRFCAFSLDDGNNTSITIVRKWDGEVYGPMDILRFYREKLFCNDRHIGIGPWGVVYNDRNVPEIEPFTHIVLAIRTLENFIVSFLIRKYDGPIIALVINYCCVKYRNTRMKDPTISREDDNFITLQYGEAVRVHIVQNVTDNHVFPNNEQGYKKFLEIYRKK
jgi:hypothetical protein